MNVVRASHRLVLRSSLAIGVTALVTACGGTTGTDGGGGHDVVTQDSSVDTGSVFDSGGGEMDVVVGPGDASDSGLGGDDGLGDSAPSPDVRTDGSGPRAGLCAAAGSTATPPATYAHVIIIMMENKSLAQLQDSGTAPYFNTLVRACGTSDHFEDNVFGATDLVSEPHYMALTSGSNCNSGLTPSGTGCMLTDNNPGAGNMLSTRSLFNQVTSWKAYQEDMGTMCGGAIAGGYAPKHNPPVFYSMLASSCHTDDLPLTALHCPTTVNTPCSAPAGAFADDLAHDTLPQLAFVTPNLTNDMHDGTITQGDNWLHTYIPLIQASAAYGRGEVAVYVMWDESSTADTAQPNLFIAPTIPPTASHTPMNLFAVLRTIETQLGITEHLGCASGTIPGGGTCPAGSTADLRTTFNF